MFYMRELPSEGDFRPLVPVYASLQPRAVMLFYSLLRAGSDLLTAFDGYLARHGISQGKFAVLLLLRRRPEEGLSPSELALQAGVTRATMTGLLNGLERDGLAAREPSEKDRRRVTIRITERGQEVLHAMFPDYFAHVAAVMEDLTERDRDVLAELIQKVEKGVSAMQRLGGEREAPGAAPLRNGG